MEGGALLLFCVKPNSVRESCRACEGSVDRVVLLVAFRERCLPWWECSLGLKVLFVSLCQLLPLLPLLMLLERKVASVVDGRKWGSGGGETWV